MTLKYFNMEFKELSIDPKVGLKDYSKLYKNGTSLKNYLMYKNISTDIKSGRTPSRFNQEYWNGEYEFLTMSDVDKLTYTINDECIDSITEIAIEEDKTLYQAKANALIISNAMTLGLSFIVDRPVYINQNVFEVSINEQEINKKFLLWYFNTIIQKLFQSTYTSKYLSKNELGRIKLPNINKKIQDEIVEQIVPMEKRLMQLKKMIINPQIIIDKVFIKEFGFNHDTFNQLCKDWIYDIDLFAFGNNCDLRQSVKFHRKAAAFVMDELKRVTNKKIKHFISEPIVLGSSISPIDYDDDGDYYYISMANIKKWKFENGDARLVSRIYSTNNQNKTVDLNDIILARSGEGTIGKVAIIEDDKIQGIFADFTMRIRLKNYNSLFAYYYFRTTYFQYLIEVNKKGLGNNTNIFPSMIQEFPIIDIPCAEQQRIVDEIKTEIDKQDIIRQQIISTRNGIEELIENVIRKANV